MLTLLLILLLLIFLILTLLTLLLILLLLIFLILTLLTLLLILLLLIFLILLLGLLRLLLGLLLQFFQFFDLFLQLFDLFAVVCELLEVVGSFRHRVLQLRNLQTADVKLFGALEAAFRFFQLFQRRIKLLGLHFGDGLLRDGPGVAMFAGAEVVERTGLKVRPVRRVADHGLIQIGRLLITGDLPFAGEIIKLGRIGRGFGFDRNLFRLLGRSRLRLFRRGGSGEQEKHRRKQQQRRRFRP